MNILVVTGSPRKGGNSDLLADSFTQGALSVGNEVRRINAGRLEIYGCNACEYCFTHNSECSIKDDMQKCYEDLYWADAIIYAMPMYYYTYPAQIKAFMDRQFCQLGGKPFPTKKTALLLVFEDKDINTADGLLQSFDIAMNYCHIEVVGKVVQNACYEKGAVKNTDALTKAFELGTLFK